MEIAERHGVELGGQGTVTEPYDPVGSFKDGFTSADGIAGPALPDTAQTLWVAHGHGVTPDAAERGRPSQDGVTLVDPSALSQTLAITARPAAAYEPGDAPEDRRPVDPTVLRFGPGVPTARDGGLDANVVAAWHGETRQPRRGGASSGPSPRWRRLRGWLLPGAVLLAVLIYVLWPRHSAPIAVLSAQVTTGSTGPACDRVVTYTGTIETNGNSGTVTYRWLRSDGTASGPFEQSVAAGEKAIQVTLRWTIAGHGAFRATASLQILSPAQSTVTAAVAYSCG